MKSLLNVKSFRSAATEILSIVIGVLLALAVNEWNENRVQTDRANEAIKNINQEIESNIALLKIVHANNTKVLKLIDDSVIGEGEELTEKQQNFIPGLQIQDTAWKTLLSTGVSEYISFSELYKISAIYSVQDIYKKLGFQLVETMMSNQALIQTLAPEKETETRSDLYLDNMKLIVEVEKGLLNLYQQNAKSKD
ncbi:MAG: hypothetical protein KC484_05025 [Colwelliaceae bacterium]|jgi:hypothetical protein|nr:hypothetical protein [Colwelliaceae bacterium]